MTPSLQYSSALLMSLAPWPNPSWARPRSRRFLIDLRPVLAKCDGLAVTPSMIPQLQASLIWGDVGAIYGQFHLPPGLPFMQRQGGCAQGAVKTAQLGIDDDGRLLVQLRAKLLDSLLQGLKQMMSQRDQRARQDDFLGIEEGVNLAGYPTKGLGGGFEDTDDQFIALFRGAGNVLEGEIAFGFAQQRPPVFADGDADGIEQCGDGGDFLQPLKFIAGPGVGARARARQDRGDRAQPLPDFARQIVPAMEDVAADNDAGRDAR